MSGGTRRPRVMLVDDERLLVESLSELLADDFDVITAGSVEDANARVATEPHIDVVLCDLHLSDGTGMDLYRACRERAPGLERRMVFFTGGNVSASLSAQLAATGCPTVNKPFDFDATIELLKRIAAG